MFLYLEIYKEIGVKWYDVRDLFYNIIVKKGRKEKWSKYNKILGDWIWE